MDKCQVLAPVVRHLLLSSPSISRTQTSCGASGHLTPCLTPQFPALTTFLHWLTSFFPISYLVCIIPSSFILRTLSISLYCFLSCYLSLWASVLPCPPGAITLSLSPSHRLGSKTGAGLWEAINHQKRSLRAQQQSRRLQTRSHNC